MLATLRASLAGAAIAMAASGWAQSTSAAVNGAQERAPRGIPLLPARATLNSTLDAKKAKLGDSVKATLDTTVQIPDEPTLPRNTVLEGHVDQAQASEHHSNSTVIITFDQARLKDGQVLPIKATVMSISQPVAMSDDGGAIPSGNADTPSGDGATVPAGGVVPQGDGSLTSRSTQSQGLPPSRGGVPQAIGSVDQSAPQPQLMNIPQDQSPQPQPQNHGVPGVMLKSDIHQSASASFLSNGRNVHLPDGTEMELVITVVPKGVHPH